MFAILIKCRNIDSYYNSARILSINFVLFQKQCVGKFKGTVMQIINNKYMIASTQVTNTEIFAFYF